MSPNFLSRAATGVPGLDDIMGGGLARKRLHLSAGTAALAYFTLTQRR
jgi:KaiC/GvpD/RAD55 family RecA-like ATPase